MGKGLGTSPALEKTKAGKVEKQKNTKQQQQQQRKNKNKTQKQQQQKPELSSHISLK